MQQDSLPPLTLLDALHELLATIFNVNQCIRFIITDNTMTLFSTKNNEVRS